MKKIDISTKTHPNTLALVDAEDFDRINSMGKWSAASDKDGGIRATRSRIVDGKYRVTKMARVIMGAAEGRVVDHINHNTLDNRKCNLRVCRQAENSWNKSKPKNNTSGYKGIYEVYPGKWRAKLLCDGKVYYNNGGSFSNKEDAATAYDILAIKHYGEFACLNDVDYINQTPETIDPHEYAIARDIRPPCLMGLSPADLAKAIKKLTYRESEVIKLRYGIGDGHTYTLKEVGKIFKVTRERVRQIEMKGLMKLKEQFIVNPDMVDCIL